MLLIGKYVKIGWGEGISAKFFCKPKTAQIISLFFLTEHKDFSIQIKAITAIKNR